MIAEALAAVFSWRLFLLALLVFGFAPGAALRLIVLAFPSDDPRRRELLAELPVIPRIQRPFWVFEQLEVALFEGLRGRVVARRALARRVLWRASAVAVALGSLWGLLLLAGVSPVDLAGSTYRSRELLVSGAWNTIAVASAGLILAAVVGLSLSLAMAACRVVAHRVRECPQTGGCLRRSHGIFTSMVLVSPVVLLAGPSIGGHWPWGGFLLSVLVAGALALVPMVFALVKGPIGNHLGVGRNGKRSCEYQNLRAGVTYTLGDFTHSSKAAVTAAVSGVFVLEYLTKGSVDGLGSVVIYAAATADPSLGIAAVGLATAATFALIAAVAVLTRPLRSLPGRASQRPTFWPLVGGWVE